MKRFFIGDMHLSHDRIIQYSNRPFKDVREMDEALIRNWNKTVNQKDEVYILGDFALTGRQKTEEYLAALKGKKYLIQGNHDHWVSNSNCRKYLEWIKDYFEIKENGNLWVLSHYPFYSWNRRNHGAIHLHAHTHKEVDLHISTETELPINRFYCVSAEVINYTPISMSELKEMFKI